MFNIKEKFEFLEDGVDFPFYNDMPKISAGKWAIIAVALVIFACLCFINSIPKLLHCLLYFLVLFVPVLFVFKGNVALLFKKPRRKDLKTVILCFLGYVIYAFAVSIVLKYVGYATVADSNAQYAGNMIFYAGLLIQLVGEELFKVLILLLVMYLVYRKSKNRSQAIYVGIISTLAVFGVAHSEAYSGRILQVILIQGLGTMFNLYAYMKTKNVVVSYFVHVLIDLSSFGIATLSHVAHLC